MTMIDVSRKEEREIARAINDIETVVNMIELLLNQYNKPWWAINNENSKYHAEEIEAIRENNDKLVESIKKLVDITKCFVNRANSISCKVIVRKINEVENSGCYDEDEDEEVNQ